MASTAAGVPSVQALATTSTRGRIRAGGVARAMEASAWRSRARRLWVQMTTATSMAAPWYGKSMSGSAFRRGRFHRRSAFPEGGFGPKAAAPDGCFGAEAAAA